MQLSYESSLIVFGFIMFCCTPFVINARVEVDETSISFLIKLQ